jgi:SAM-dependent methyltransferase
MEVFGDYAYYYNSFYKDKDYVQEAVIVNGLLKKYAAGNVVKLLNMGCGTGRHDLELCRLGYQVHGIDLSDAMIEVAKKQVENLKVNGVSFEVGNICSYNVQDIYDGVISLFHVISYQTDNESLLKAFKTAASALDCGGIFVFDAWYGPGVLSDKPGVRVKRVEDGQNILVRYANPIMHAMEDTVDVEYDVLIIDKETFVTKQIKETHRMRYLFTPHVVSLLDMAEFDLIDCIDCNTLEEADYNSWTTYFIARKR